VGVVDWETLERSILYRGTIGEIAEEGAGFTAELVSRKAELQRDFVPRTSPTCRAEFCGPGCTLSAARFDHAARIVSHAFAQNAVTLDLALPPEDLVGGSLRWLDGPFAGMHMGIAGVQAEGLVLDRPLDRIMPPGLRVRVREGCDHTLATCAARFGNAANFQGEPFVPGNDQITRYGSPTGGSGQGGK
jgi:uncharacterized phage protein (TIGR02218 family)